MKPCVLSVIAMVVASIGFCASTAAYGQMPNLRDVTTLKALATQATRVASWTPSASNPSCRSAYTAYDKLVCGIPALTALDRDQKVAFNDALGRATSTAERANLVYSQRHWDGQLKSDVQRQICNDAACVEARLTERIAALQAPAPPTTQASPDPVRSAVSQATQPQGLADTTGRTAPASPASREAARIADIDGKPPAGVAEGNEAVPPEAQASPSSVEPAQLAAEPAASPAATDSNVSSRANVATKEAEPSSNQMAHQNSVPTATADVNAVKNDSPEIASTARGGSDSETPWVLWLVGIAGIVGGLAWSVIRTNAYCDEKYDYQPFNLVITGVMALGFALFMGSVFTLPDGWRSFGAVPFPGHSNFFILFALGVFSPIGCFAYLAKRTNFRVSLFATATQLVLAPLALLALVVVLMASGSRGSSGSGANSKSRSSGSGSTDGGGSGGARSTPSRSKMYQIQAMSDGGMVWIRYGGSPNVGQAIQMAKRQVASLQKRSGGLGAIRVVEMVDGAEGSTVWSN